VACPKDMTMYSDAAKTTGHEDTMAVVDVVQLLDAAVDREALKRLRNPTCLNVGESGVKI
jgi:hypothetical protein